MTPEARRVRITRYRQRAKEMYDEAEVMKDVDVKALTLQVATNYEKLAKALERLNERP